MSGRVGSVELARRIRAFLAERESDGIGGIRAAPVMPQPVLQDRCAHISDDGHLCRQATEDGARFCSRLGHDRDL